MEQVILMIHIVLAFALIGLVLMQHGKGAEAGAAFGSGASSTVFGSRGSGSFLSRMTTILALCFAITSLSLAYLATHRESKSALDELTRPIQQMVIESESKESSLPEVPTGDAPVVPDEE